MVPSIGIKSNFNTTQNDVDLIVVKADNDPLEALSTIEGCDTLFNTLSDWCVYLDNDVPYFNHLSKLDEIEP